MYAEDSFQLLEARTANVRVEMPWRRERPYMNPHAVFSRQSFSRLPNQQEDITAIIGKNGTGKSHLLGAIVRTFIAIEEYQLRKQRKLSALPLDYLAYMSDGKHCIVEQDQQHQTTATVDGIKTPLLGLPLPRRVVALTISPFDKFPVPRMFPHSVAPVEATMYQYLGLRDRFGKASIESLLYRSLSSLFDQGENEALRRSNIGAVFDFLKLKPTVNVIYRLRDTHRLREAVSRRLHLGQTNVLSPSQQRRVEDVERSGISEVELRNLLELAYQRAIKGRIETRADFEHGGILDDLFYKLQPIRRAGFLNLVGVEVTHHSGLSSDLRSASSGTLSMVSALISLASVISNGSLVLIDEPELSLHPEWQVKYIDLLVKTFARYRGCHFVVATHSPLVISELPAHAEVISLDQDGLPPTRDLQGQSSDFLLAEAFGLPTNGNLYVKGQIVEALRLVANGKARSEQFKEILAELQKFGDDLADDDPSKTIIENLKEVANHAGRKAQT
jgi:predicted ATPase